MKKGRVLFIIHDLFQDFNCFPLNIAYLAAALRDQGAEVEIYCQDLYHFSNEELADYLDDNRFDLIGISFLAARFEETVVGLCEVVNRHKKDAWLVLGGHGPAPIPEYILERTRADVVATGEAEETIVEILDSKHSGTPSLDSIAGIAWRSGDDITVNLRRKPISNLDRISFPAWELFPMEDYANSLKVFEQPGDEKSLAFTSSRGCVNACTFCYRMEKGIRARSNANIVEEIKILVNDYGIRYFFIFDELFVLNKKRLFEFEDLLDRNGLDIRFSCDARVDILDREMVECLKRCGCIFLNFGIESVDDHVLKLMKKNTTAEQNAAAIETVLSVGGIGVGLNILWGNIGDTAKSLRDGVAFIKKYNTYKQIRTIRPPTPYPGCELYYTAIEKGLLTGPADFFDKFKNSDLYLVNFTDLPIERYYELLLEANAELIRDHYRHTGEEPAEGEDLISQFRDLYTGKNLRFRGARKFRGPEEGDPDELSEVSADRKA